MAVVVLIFFLLRRQQMPAAWIQRWHLLHMRKENEKVQMEGKIRCMSIVLWKTRPELQLPVNERAVGNPVETLSSSSKH